MVTKGGNNRKLDKLGLDHSPWFRNEIVTIAKVTLQRDYSWVYQGHSCCVAGISTLFNVNDTVVYNIAVKVNYTKFTFRCPDHKFSKACQVIHLGKPCRASDSSLATPRFEKQILKITYYNFVKDAHWKTELVFVSISFSNVFINIFKITLLKASLKSLLITKYKIGLRVLLM